MVKAGILSGEFYVPAVVLFATCIPMALYPSVGLTIFGIASALSFAIPGAKFHWQRLQADRGGSLPMTSRPQLPRTAIDWLRVFGPGAIIASLTIGTGELIFSTRGGAIFGYDILYVFAIISLLKWSLVVSTSRHMILTGVHPYERMADLPGPRGWMPIMLLLMATVSLPIWISFHAGVVGNLTSWITGTRHLLHGGADYLWGAVILALVLLLSATGGYSSVGTSATVCRYDDGRLRRRITLVLYKPDWLESVVRHLPDNRLRIHAWLDEKYPDIARHSVWV